MSETDRRLADTSAFAVLGGELERAAKTMPAAGRSRTRSRAAGIAGVSAMAIVLAVTPAGPAIAGAFGNLVGIGDEPTISHEGPDAPVATRARPVVVATGETPTGVSYEMVAFMGANSFPSEGEIPNDSANNANTSACFSLDFPTESNPFGTAVCGAAPRELTPPSFNETRYGGSESTIQMEGLVGAEVASVLVSYETDDGLEQQVPVAFGRLEGDLTDRVGADNDLGYYVAFLPREPFPNYDAEALETIRVDALNSDGEALTSYAHEARAQDVAQRSSEARCLRDAIKPFAEAQQRVPLAELQRQCAEESP